MIKNTKKEGMEKGTAAIILTAGDEKMSTIIKKIKKIKNVVLNLILLNLNN